VFTTIVVGVDGRPGGRDALELAQRLSDLDGGELVAVHVAPYEPIPLRGLRPDFETDGRDEVREPPRSPSVPRSRPAATGRGLAEAVRSINEGAAMLAESRRDGARR
jgi:nucleotide-binding universal stress UspA family protein